MTEVCGIGAELETMMFHKGLKGTGVALWLVLLALATGLLTGCTRNTVQAYLEEIEPTLGRVVKAQNDYNEVAKQSDRLKTAEAYRAQVEQAKSYDAVMETSLIDLSGIKPPSEAQTYHRLQLTFFFRERDFLREIQIAYDGSLPDGTTSRAYAVALSIKKEIDALKRQMADELVKLVSD